MSATHQLYQLMYKVVISRISQGFLNTYLRTIQILLWREVGFLPFCLQSALESMLSCKIQSFLSKFYQCSKLFNMSCLLFLFFSLSDHPAPDYSHCDFRQANQCRSRLPHPPWILQRSSRLNPICPSPINNNHSVGPQELRSIQPYRHQDSAGTLEVSPAFLNFIVLPEIWKIYSFRRKLLH